MRLPGLFKAPSEQCATLKSWEWACYVAGQVYKRSTTCTTTTTTATVPHKGVAQRATIIAVWTKNLNSSTCRTNGLHMYMCQVKYQVIKLSTFLYVLYMYSKWILCFQRQAFLTFKCTCSFIHNDPWSFQSIPDSNMTLWYYWSLKWRYGARKDAVKAHYYILCIRLDWTVHEPSCIHVVLTSTCFSPGLSETWPLVFSSVLSQNLASSWLSSEARTTHWNIS